MLENNLLQNEKNRFLADEFFMLSWCAAVQRNQTFASLDKQDSKDKKAEFRRVIKNAIFKILPLYAETTVSRERHLENIALLIKISEPYSDILKECNIEEDGGSDSSGKLKAGTAQKLLNMMLKYCWCAGWINMPPDMPIDKHNLDELHRLSKSQETDFKKSWTKDLAEMSDYTTIITKAESTVKEPLAVWELIHWRRNADDELTKF